MKPTARWWSKSLPTPAPNRKTLLPVTSNADRHRRLNRYLHSPWGRFNLKLYVCTFCRDSCQRGWRLLYILTAFHRCSDVMKPFLLKFLQGACASPGVHYQGRRTIHPSIHGLKRCSNPSTTQRSSDLSVDWLLFLLDRYCQGMWAESEEDFSIRRACTVSQQHGTQSYAGWFLIQCSSHVWPLV